MSEVTEASLVVVNRGRGRPSVPEPKVPVTFYISPRHYEGLRKLSELYSVSVSKFGGTAIEKVVDRAIDLD